MQAQTLSIDDYISGHDSYQFLDLYPNKIIRLPPRYPTKDHTADSSVETPLCPYGLPTVGSPRYPTKDSPRWRVQRMMQAKTLGTEDYISPDADGLPRKPDPETETRNAEPGTRKQEPGTRNSEPGTRNPKPETRNPKR
ncbi:hypothetical protein T484DRAFT_1978399 [Baffinella frigidus]|nr:hypothetical protein T484DRAFT_1978399 [Cryptophyta sp. CCMP2293]